MSKTINAMTVDVEDYYQVSAFENTVQRKAWDTMESRVEKNIENVLQLFDDTNTTATFFMLGWIAEKHPAIARSIVSRGHELASHGYSHVRVTAQKPDEFVEDVVKTKNILEEAAGVEIIGYRAASFSINQKEHWAHEKLASAGYKYSSSVYPVYHDHYGVPDAPFSPYRPFQGPLLEIPVTTTDIMGMRVPCGGGGYFRLLPLTISKWLISHINSRENRSCIFYFHPWEIDPEQPKIEDISFKTQFRHYNGLKTMRKKLLRLTSTLSWQRMDQVFESQLQ